MLTTQPTVGPDVTGKRVTVILSLLVALAIIRLWLLPLHSSFWVDELATAFLVHYGASHPSFAIAPQVTESIYYWLPRVAEKLFGFSELVYRIPSVLASGIALIFIARLAQRLIHPDAGWFAVFACFTLRLFNYEAADARPYALGMCIASISLWYLVRWFDNAHTRDALLFVIFAALLWRVHLIYWPFYLVFVIYAISRLLTHDTPVSWAYAVSAFVILGLLLVPVALRAIAILHEAKAHVIVTHPPTLSEMNRALKLSLVIGSLAGAAILGRILRWPQPRTAFTPSTFALILGWWLTQPLVLFAFSWITHNSVFVDRYLGISLPGAALAATLAAAYFLPPEKWKFAAAICGGFAVLLMGGGLHLNFVHHGSDWRAATRAVNDRDADSSAPVIYPSPFIEARSPAWSPNYQLPGFLYSYLATYHVNGKPYLLPFETSHEAERYAAELASGPLPAANRFFIYGGDVNVKRWQVWFAARPELAGWSSRRLGPFGDVEVAMFEKTLIPQ